MDVDDLCDFCSTPLGDEAFTHFTTTFGLDLVVDVGYIDRDGEWLACPRCHALLLAGDKDAIEATVPVADAKSGIPWSLARAHRRQMLDAFWGNYTGVWEKVAS